MIKFSKKVLIISFLVSFFLSSCFDIVEEIELRKDGSGAFTYTLNLSQSRSTLKTLMFLDSIDGFKIPLNNEIDETLNFIKEIAHNIRGISNVNVSSDHENYIFRFQCSFTEIDAINRMIASLEKTDKNFPDALLINHFSYIPSQKTYIRHSENVLQGEYYKLNDTVKELLRKAQYISINRFDSEVLKCENTNAVISTNKKAVILKTNILAMIDNQKKTVNKIFIK